MTGFGSAENMMQSDSLQTELTACAISSRLNA